MDGDGVEISRVKTGGIPNPELGKAQELVVFFFCSEVGGFLWEVQGLVGFPFQGLVAVVQIFHLKISIIWKGPC